MSDILSEIDQAVRQDRISALWKKYGNLLIGAAILIVLITAVSSFYQNHHTQYAKDKTGDLLTLLSQENYATKIESQEINNDVYDGIARLFAAHQELADNNVDLAIRRLSETANIDKAPDILIDYALLNSGFVYVSGGTKKDEGLDNYMADLQRISEEKSSPWRFHATYFLAYLKAEKFGDMNAARQLLEDLILREDIPASLRNRAAALSHIYSQLPSSKS